MHIIKILRSKVFIALAVTMMIPSISNATECNTKLFTATMDSKLTIADAIENLADSCGLTIIVKDDAAKKRLNKRLYYVKLNNSTLNGFLDIILSENDLIYTLRGNKLTISYLTTKTFRIHYIAGKRTGTSKANVTIASNGGDSSGGESAGSAGNSGSETGISIDSEDSFDFWDRIEKEIQRVLIGAGDGSTHYIKNSDEKWTGPDGKEWEYNPVAPIVNPTAGMITVTGTVRQIQRVSQYIKTLTKQIKSQVLIDVRILSVEFDNSKTTGVDWNQIYGLQNFSLSSSILTTDRITPYPLTDGGGDFPMTLDATSPEDGADTSSRGAIFEAGASAKITDLVRFLGTQGDVKSISSPRVLTLNNQPALISVGKELFYKIKSSSTASSGGGATAAEGEVVSSVFAGILLDITPEISSNGMITLKINPSITDTASSVSSDAGVIRTIPPDLIRRQIASVITVKDGHHAVLGGLISTKNGFRVSKVPLLGDLPLLEYMFKREEKIEKVEELVIIITPHIIKSSRDISLKDLGYKKLRYE
jgi:general secretion pathway protein D